MRSYHHQPRDIWYRFGQLIGVVGIGSAFVALAIWSARWFILTVAVLVIAGMHLGVI